MVKKKIVKKVKKEEVVLDVADDMKEIEEKRDKLIAEIKPHLLTKSQLRTGGSNIRFRHAQEKGYEAVIPEINELGKELGLPPIGLGHLRKN